MKSEKVQKFFSKLVEMTKSGAIRWNRCSARVVDAEMFRADNNSSFFCGYNHGIIILASNYDGTISCFIQPDEDLDYDLFGENDAPELKRLYNLVFSRFPSLDSFVDMIINSEN